MTVSRLRATLHADTQALRRRLAKQLRRAAEKVEPPHELAPDWARTISASRLLGLPLRLLQEHRDQLSPEQCRLILEQMDYHRQRPWE